jgi:hypothetical protein
MSEHHHHSDDELTLADLAPGVPRPRSRTDSDGLIRDHDHPTFKDDFVLAASADADDTTDYERLLPPDGMSPAERRALNMPLIPLTIEEEPQRPLTQFTVAEMFGLTTFLSVGFAVMYYLPPDKVAGVLGILALVGQGVLMRFPPENRHVHLGASVLLVMYGIAAAVAFCQHFFAS